MKTILCIKCNQIFLLNKNMRYSLTSLRLYKEFLFDNSMRLDLINKANNVICPFCKAEFEVKYQYFGVFTKKIIDMVIVIFLLAFISYIIWDTTNYVK